MRKNLLIAIIAVLTWVSAFAGTPIVPHTTLKAETSNNTSTADLFPGWSNGLPAASNVSKVSIKKLLYPGSTTKLYVHYQPWFGTTSHKSVGYSENDQAQVARQVTDMASRGIDGGILYWSGPKKTFNHTTNLLFMAEAEKHAGFEFAVQEDKEALSTCAATPGCDLTGQVITDLNAMATSFFASSAYMRKDGRPVVFFFGTEAYVLDWTRIRAGVTGNPLFIYRNSGSFALTYSNGGFAWASKDTTATSDIGISYLDRFYSKALAIPTKHAFGAAYPGFDDSMASWGNDRIIQRNCGQTWLDTMARIGNHYSSANQLDNLQIVTWNDYEEGSAIEPGIDNCVEVTASVGGNTLNWGISGSENTIDHLEVFISLDGTNLMQLAQLPATARSIDLAEYALDPATYTLLVKAVGMPSMINKMSNPTTFTIANQTPVAVLTMSALSGIAPVTLQASTSGSNDSDGSISNISIDFGDGSAASTGANASHEFTSPGTYPVRATVTDNLGATSTATATVVIAANVVPLASISVTPANGIAPVNATASTLGSTDVDGKIVSSSIGWGDGAISDGFTASHNYSVPGNYTVTATVVDDRGATASSSVSITIAEPAPVATGKVEIYAPTANATVGSPVRVAAGATASLGVSSTKIYVDGTAVYSSAASLVDAQIAMSPGTRRLTVQSWDTAGNVYKNSIYITVKAPNQPPVASLSVSATTAVAPAVITASTAGSTDADGKVMSSIIAWGDGGISSAATASHTYPTPGTYTVTATIVDDAGASSTTSATVIIKAPAPTGSVNISYPVTGSTVGNSVRVKASSTATLGIVAMKIYVDNVIDYSTALSQLDTYLKMSRGSHKVTVQAWDAAGTVYKNSVAVTVK